MRYVIVLLLASVVVLGQTNGVPATNPFTNVLDSFNALLSAAFALYGAIATIVARIKAKQAGAVETLIQAIEGFNNSELKRQIKSQAEHAGTEATLSKLVKAITKGKQ